MKILTGAGIGFLVGAVLEYVVMAAWLSHTMVGGDEMARGTVFLVYYVVCGLPVGGLIGAGIGTVVGATIGAK